MLLSSKENTNCPLFFQQIFKTHLQYEYELKANLKRFILYYNSSLDFVTLESSPWDSTGLCQDA